VESENAGRLSLKQKLVAAIRRREVYAQDKLLGIAEMVRAIREGRPQPTPPDFLLHVNELTLLIQRAGPNGIAVPLTTTFKPLEPLPEVTASKNEYLKSYRPRLLEKMLGGIVERMQGN
jgi:hypothetical protein